jgi:hypothetical protein
MQTHPLATVFFLQQLLQAQSSLPIDEVEYLDLSRKDIGMYLGNTSYKT